MAFPGRRLITRFASRSTGLYTVAVFGSGFFFGVTGPPQIRFLSTFFKSTHLEMMPKVNAGGGRESTAIGGPRVQTRVEKQSWVCKIAKRFCTVNFAPSRAQIFASLALAFCICSGLAFCICSGLCSGLSAFAAGSKGILQQPSSE